MTAIGLGAGMLGLSLYPARLALALLGASLALDIADGALARALGAVTSEGALFDWHTDVALAHVGAVQAGLFPVANLALVPLQAIAAAGGARVSGRALVFAFLVGRALLA